ncbi:hypothetical protein, partial [Escherichia coli]|uniref:hypothetical protein n=1 Tax=Escherichia coli TaxID=562 RepID=UPI00207B27E9
SPYDVERLYGKPFADCAIGDLYPQLVADERVRKTLSLGVVIPDITFQLAKEDAQMALFSPYDVERLYGKPFADCAIGDLYPQLVADERVRK